MERAARGGLNGIAPFDASEFGEFRVDKYSTISLKQNHYSVPEGHVGEWVKVKAGAEKICIFSDGNCIAEHKRSWQTHQWIMDIYHYLKTFQKKKGALTQSECLSQAPKEIKKIYTEHYIGNEKDFLELLLYVRERANLARVTQAIQQLKKNPLVHITTEKVIFIAEQDSPVTKVKSPKDDVTSQSVQNLSTLTALFETKNTGVLH